MNQTALLDMTILMHGTYTVSTAP
jgi:hypothetical protein